MYISLTRKIEEKELKTCYLTVKEVASVSQARCRFSRKRRHIMPCEVILLLFKEVLLNGSVPGIELTSTYNVKGVLA